MESAQSSRDGSVFLRHPAEYAATGIALALGAVVLLGGVGPFGTRLPPAFSSVRLPSLLALFIASAGYVAIRFRRNAKFRGVPVRELDPGWLGVIFGLFVAAFAKAAFLDHAAFAPSTIGQSAWDLSMRDALRGYYLDSGGVGIRSAPIVGTLLPLQALFRTPYLLVFAPAIVLVLGAWALDRHARAKNLATETRLAIVVAYLLSAPIASAIDRGFHPEIFYPIGVFIAAGAIARRSILEGAIALAILLSVRSPARGFGHEHGPLLVAIAFAATVEAYAWLRARSRATAVLFLAIALAGAAFGGKKSLVMRSPDLEAWAAAKEIFRRVPEGSPVCAPLILIPHAPYSLGISPLDRACLDEAAYAVVFTHARNPENAAIARTLEVSPRWKPEARAAGIESFKRIGK